MTQITLDQALQIAFQHHRAGRLAEAELIYRRILTQQPDHAEACHELANALLMLGRREEAVAAYREAVRINPDHAIAHYNLGIALQSIERPHDAIAAYRQAIRFKSDFVEAHNNLGNVFKGMGRFEEAVASYRHAARLNPNSAETQSNLGHALKGLGRLDEAVIACQRAVDLNPDLAEAHNNLGNALNDMWRIDEEITAYREALRLKPDFAVAHDNLLFALHYQPNFDPVAFLAQSREWNRRHADPLRRFIQPHANDRHPNRRLRIAYVSPDFHDHPVSRFLQPLLAAHDHTKFEIFAYAQVPLADKITDRLKSCCDTWRSAIGESDQRVAEMIRQDRIDILIDLAGHTAGNRLLVFAHKPAPVQCTWLGYPGTTGLEIMDHRFTDSLADPPGKTEQFCSEQLIRLPRTAWCFQPPDDTPVVNDLPATKNGHVTFGSFNNFAKVNEPLLNLWAKILHTTPGAKLLLKAKPLGYAPVQLRVRQIMSMAGIDPRRLELVSWVAPGEHLAQYHRVDIALDTYPYHGTTTTCESLWMGVPVVSLAGESHVSRVGASLLTNVGLPHLIAQTPQQYVKIAADLAADLPRLTELRRTLRAQMQASPLIDAPRFARDVEAAYRRFWRSWCQKTIAEEL